MPFVFVIVLNQTLSTEVRHFYIYIYANFAYVSSGGIIN